MESDRELLLLAAKAAGADYEADIQPGGGLEIITSIGGVSGYWNPLEDDGDALRLAVKLRLRVSVYADQVEAGRYEAPSAGVFVYEDGTADINAATRRAIVRAAAEIGRDAKEDGNA